MNNKKIFFTFGILLVLGLLVVGGIHKIESNNKFKNGFGYIYITPNEKELIPNILKNLPNTIIVIPEEKSIRGNIETLDKYGDMIING